MYVPDIIVAKKTIVLSLRNGEIDSTCSVPGPHYITDVDGFVVWTWVSVVDDEEDLSKQKPHR